MADVTKRLAGPARLAAAAADLYTAPGATTATVTHIRISNPDTVAYTFTLSVGADGVTTRSIAESKVLPPGRVFDDYGEYVLAATEKIQGFASTANKLVYEIDGVEST